MSNHEQPTPSHPKSDVRNTTGKNKQIPQDSVRTTSAVDLEEFCEKHYEKLLPIMADKYEYEKRKKEKLEEVKARLDFGDTRKKSTRAQESASRIRKEGRAPCSRDSEAEDGVPPCIPIGVRKAQGIWKITLKVKIVKAGIGSLNYEGKKSSVKDDDLSQPWVCAETDPFTNAKSCENI
ncbi:hypothetical protein Tco_0918110 [Tanacetum coccineum]